MRYYISAAYANHGLVKKLSTELSLTGHVCAYDWDSQGDIRDNVDVSLTESSFVLVQSIRDAELYIFICPSTRTSSVELGIALSSRYGKRIIVWSEKGADFEHSTNTCIYYFHPSVTRLVCSFEELVAYIKTI